MNGRTGRNFQSRETIEHALAFTNESAELAGLRLPQQRFQIRPSNENRLLGRIDDNALERALVLDEIEMLIEITNCRSVEDVRSRIRPIEREQANCILSDLATNCLHRLRDSHRIHIVPFPAKSKL